MSCMSENLSWFQKNIWLFFVLGLLGSMIVLSTSVLVFAIRQDVATVSNTPYEDAMRYDEILAAKKRAEKFQVNPSLQFEAQEGSYKVQAQLKDSKLSFSNFALEARRADNERYDRKFACTRTGAVEFACEGELPKAGYWTFTSFFQSEDGLLVHEQQVVVR